LLYVEHDESAAIFNVTPVGDARKTTCCWTRAVSELDVLLGSSAVALVSPAGLGLVGVLVAEAGADMLLWLAALVMFSMGTEFCAS
jgi:hypothetical protein